ncbi:DUF2938 family protein [Oceanicaulis sp.]|uniref:DUF2938 family protein n=1 Tax=Oceanicaulis sp. TaxID=1924941 RepID=UPI003F7278DB
MTSGGVTYSVLLGLGASLIMDIWAVLRQQATGAPMLDYGWLARWIDGLKAGRLSVSPEQEAPLSVLERVLGWALHYAIGMVYAGLFVLIMGRDWVTHPAITPALVFGAITALAPFLILQPALGRGLFASRTRTPWSARIQTLITHLIFGAGLFATAIGMARLEA